MTHASIIIDVDRLRAVEGHIANGCLTLLGADERICNICGKVDRVENFMRTPDTRECTCDECARA